MTLFLHPPRHSDAVRLLLRVALDEARELPEHESRMGQMAVNIDKMRKDMRAETRNIVIQILVGAAACIGAGVTLANYVTRNQAPPQIIYVPTLAAPGTK